MTTTILFISLILNVILGFLGIKSYFERREIQRPFPVRIIKVATEFSRFPAGRFRSDSKFSGEEFREKYLIPALNVHDSFIVDLNGTMGFGSDFLDEAFGGLTFYRKHNYSSNELHKRMSFISEDTSLITEVWNNIDAYHMLHQARKEMT